MTQSGGPQAAALAALTDLVDTATTYRDATPKHRPGWRQNWDTLRTHLDAVRTTLIQEGDDYLPVAWAFVDSGRLTIARHLVRIQRRTQP